MDLATQPQVWAGVECSFLQVGDRTVDQLTSTGHRFRPADIDLLASLKPAAVRYPVIWGWPNGRQETDWEWAADRLERLRRHNIRPIIGLLHHGYGPAGRSAADPDFVEAFAAYAGKVARHFPWIESYLPINEPLTTSRFGGLYGWWPPHAQSRQAFAVLIVQQCLAIRAAIRAIRAVRPGAKLYVNEDGGKTYGTEAMRDQIAWNNDRRWLTFDLLTGRVGREHPLHSYLYGVRAVRRGLDSLRDDPEAPDVLGLDYYVTSDRWLDHRTELYPVAVHGGNRHRPYADVELARMDGAPIAGFSRCLRETWDRYRSPIALMEVDLAGSDADKLAWWTEAWTAACTVAKSGVPVAGVTAWSVFGAYDWATVLRRADGAYEPGAFDVRADPPQPTQIGAHIAATSLSAPDDVFQTAGWWRRRERVLYRRPRIGRSGKGVAEEPQRIPAHHPVNGLARQTRVKNSVSESR